MIELMATSKSVCAKGHLSRQLLPPPLLSLWSSPADRDSTGDPSLAGSFGSVSCGVTAPFLWILVQPRFSLCLSSLESLFPPFLWKSCNQILLGFKVRFHGDTQSLCCVPRLGSLMGSSEPSQQWENFFGGIVLQFVGDLPGGCETWFYLVCASPTISLQLLLCLWTWGICFDWIPASSCQCLFNS